MTYTIAWISPLSPKSGIGSFSKAILDHFPKTVRGEAIDVTAFYVEHADIYRTAHRSVKIIQEESFRDIFGVFDLLVYNIGNNREHHEAIYELLRYFPGIVICHDHVYQHYLADRCMRANMHFASYAALLQKFSGPHVGADVRRSQITSRIGRIRYSPWDTAACTSEPMSEPLFSLGSALVVHSEFSRRHAERHFAGPILQLGMPHDLRASALDADHALIEWRKTVMNKPVFDLVSFGHIQSSKCLDLIVEAIGMSEDLRRRTKYTIAGYIGDPAYYEDLRSSVEALGLQDVVCFEPGVSESRLQELMLKADIFLNLRRPNTEAASLSLIEQLNFGRPVVIVDSGCYAEVPNGGALKIQAEPTSKRLCVELEALIKAPAKMVEIGRVGQRYGRTWTCGRYAEALVSFALQHKQLMARRASAVFCSASLHQPRGDDEEWLRKLGSARASLIYLDANILPVDPSLVMSMSSQDLCAYVAEVIFGLFNNPALLKALPRYFARLSRSEAYWACVRFSLIADAVFNGDEGARVRLINGEGCYDPEFWSILESFPPRHFCTAAAFLIAKRTPTADELEQCEQDRQDNFPMRSRLAAFLKEAKDRSDVLSPLREWAQEPQSPRSGTELTISENVEIHAGAPAFGTSVELSGFYAMEHDRVWSRGHRGFIGLRLACGTSTVELQVAPLMASKDEPNEITLDFKGKVCRVELEDTSDVWLRLSIEVYESTSDVQWIELTTSRASVPPNSSDARFLGVCVRALRVSAQRRIISLHAERDAAAS